VNGVPVGCDDRGCVVAAGGGPTIDTIFVLDIEGFDSDEPPERIRHLMVEARRIERAPPRPCYEGVAAGKLSISGREVTLLDCPVSTARAQAAIRHGEGAHSGHLLGFWDEGGVRYVVSVHGATEQNRSLLRGVVSSIEVVGTSRGSTAVPTPR
jgi:hypothetical protein